VRAHRAAIGLDEDRPAALGDAPDGVADLHPPAELGGHAQRQALRAADHALLLRAAARVEQPVEVARRRLVARRGDVEEDEQERQVPRLDAEDGLDADVEQEAPARRGRHRLLERLERLPVQLGRAGRGPRRVARDGLGHLVELGDRRAGLGRAAVGRHRPERPGGRVARPVAVADEDVVAGVVGRERVDPELAARAIMRSCVGPIHWPPTSNHCPPGAGTEWTRPPTRSRASSTTTLRPAATSARAALTRRSRRR
jgi:hypothetical protein